MVIFLIILICIVTSGLKAAGNGEFFNDYISKSQTVAINGVFTVLVIFRHASGYLSFDGPLDNAFITFDRFMSQLIVVTFLFYSGFGMMESVKKKGKRYILTIPTRRFLKVLYHFDLAVVLYLVTNIIIGNPYSPKEIFLAFVGWTSIGNSNWYIFVILIMYILVFVSFLCTGGNKYAAVTVMCVLSVLFIMLNEKVNRPFYCYNTAFLFPLGMLFSLLKAPYERLMRKNDAVWFFMTGLTAISFAALSFVRVKEIVLYTLWAFLFMMIILAVSMKIKVGNGILNWFGSHVFSVYILQRLPMMVLQKLGVDEHRYAFIIISFIVTVVLAVLFDFAVEKLDRLIYSKKSKTRRKKQVKASSVAEE